MSSAKKSRVDYEDEAAVYRPARAMPLPPALEALPPKLKVFIKHDTIPTAEELGRPAKRQADPETLAKTSYIQGNDDYNIWYGKYASARVGPDGKTEKFPAPAHCNPFQDSGFTQADINPQYQGNPICLYFARGICTKGPNCKYYHRVPTMEDNDKLDLMKDIFGRERHNSHRDDMQGVGCFNTPSNTLYVGDFAWHDSCDILEKKLHAHFALYGPVDEISTQPGKQFAFVTFSYRAAAEFAKVAMSGWRLDKDPAEILIVRWALPSRKPAEQARQRQRENEEAERIMRQRLRQARLNEMDVLHELTLRAEDEVAEEMKRKDEGIAIDGEEEDGDELEAS